MSQSDPEESGITDQFSDRSNLGMTLIELLLVVAIIAIIGTLSVTRIDSLIAWKQEGDIRKFASTWQLLFHEAFARGQSYRLVIDLDQGHYYVLREIPQESNQVRQVDRLENLRTKKEQARRAAKEIEEMPSLEEQYRDEDARQSAPVEVLYYKSLFSVPHGPTQLGTPLEFPSLTEKQQLTDGLKVRAVTVRGKKIETGQTYIRLSPERAGEIAAVYFQLGEQIFTCTADPATGTVNIKEGEHEFFWIEKTGLVAE